MYIPSDEPSATALEGLDLHDPALYVPSVSAAAATSLSLTCARAQMELSLGFHIIFSALGIAMPLLMVLAEGRYVAGKGDHYRDLARTWGKATALLFAVGAVSGTALSFELGLLWPKLMETTGAAIGPAFVVEGYAFFLEAIFVGLYLYGWERLTPKQHLWCGIPVAVSGLVSGILVVAANAWMQAPAAYTVDASGAFVPTSMWTAFASPMWIAMSIHSSLACYAAVGFAVAGVYAVALLRARAQTPEDALSKALSPPRSREYLHSALRLSLAVGGSALLLQMISGDRLAKQDAEIEPPKLAALEAHYETSRGAPLLVMGWPDSATREVHGAIAIPHMLSFLAHDDFDAEVIGLDRVPREEWPNVQVCHLSFDIMVGAGSLLAALAVWVFVDRFRARRTAREEPRLLLRALVFASPLGFVALEAGWTATEAGRQPWVVRGLLRTADAVTHAPGVPTTFFGFALLYILLGGALIGLLRALAHLGGNDDGHGAHARAHGERESHVAR